MSFSKSKCYDPTILPPQSCKKNVHSCLFTVAKNWQQPKDIIGKQINKVQHNHVITTQQVWKKFLIHMTTQTFCYIKDNMHSFYYTINWWLNVMKSVVVLKKIIMWLPSFGGRRMMSRKGRKKSSGLPEMFYSLTCHGVYIHVNMSN